MSKKMSKRKKKALSNAARMLSLQGAAKGGEARAKKLSPEERSAIASRAGKARWKDKTLAKIA